MDHDQYSSVMAAVAGMPDPRHARGKRLEWPFIWGVIVSGLLSQHRTPAAIAQWAQRQATALVAAFRPAHGRVPSESTLRRALQRVDVVALERQVVALDAPVPIAAAPPASPMRGPGHRRQTCARCRRARSAHRAGQPGDPPRRPGRGTDGRRAQTPREPGGATVAGGAGVARAW